MNCQITCVLLLLSAYGALCQDNIRWESFMDGITIEEELEEGTQIAILRAIDTTTNTSEGIEYGFNSVQNVFDDSINEEITYFKIDRYTGVVTINNPFSYDGFLDIKTGTTSNELKTIDVYMIAKKGNEFKKVVSELFVKNINDEFPVFVNNSMVALVTENTIPPPEGILIMEDILITDVDSIFTNIGRMEITIEKCVIFKDTDNVICPSWFELRPSRGRSSSMVYMNLYLTEPLDYEVIKDFQVELLAFDGKQSTNTDVKISVLDTADSPPVWVEIPTNTLVEDDTVIGGMRIKVLARDTDSVQRNISYKFRDGQVNQGVPITDVFTIDQRSGLVTNKVVMDIDKSDFFFMEDTQQSRMRWEIQIEACEIISENPLVVSTNTALDCADIGIIFINLFDVNDNAPIFIGDPYIYEIYENIETGAYLLRPRILVDDPDQEGNNNFRVEIVNPVDEFALLGENFDPVIQVADTRLIDYDRGPQFRLYQLTLRAYDVDNVTLENYATVEIHILDVNDIVPDFTEDIYEAFVPEDSQEGHFVIQISARDNDSGSFGADGIHYDFSGVGMELFDINHQSGTITVAFCPAQTYGVRPCLDYDNIPRSYDFTVTATDFNNKGNEGVARLRVILTDKNDNAPQVGNYSASIFENERFFPTPGLFVQGTDEDQGSVLTYRIVNQSPGQFWQIDSVTGEISVNKPNNAGIKFLDGVNQGKFEVVVEVSDGIYASTSYVFIQVIDINDNAPYFVPSIYRITIPETTGPAVFILTVTAKDADDPTSRNGQLQFRIVSGNVGGAFFLDEQTGEIFSSSSPAFQFDRATYPSYTLLVKVQDGGTPQLEGNATVYIDILETNNKDPFIVPILQTFEVLENALNRTFIGNVIGGDPDDGAVLVYRFTGDMEAFSSSGFVVDKNVFDFTKSFTITGNGTILVNGPLDSEKANIITIGVEVEDIAAEGTGPQIGRGTVIIFVNPYNAVPPVFIQLEDTITIKEERPFGTTVSTIIAQDDDGIQEYLIVEQPHNFFTIGARSGAVQIFGRIDYDDARRLNTSSFIVTVTDRGDPQRTATASVNVIFENINDNYPQFVRSPGSTRVVNLYTATIPENSPDGTSVVNVFTIDNDRPDDAGFHDVEYFMNDERFDVNRTTGEIFVSMSGSGLKLDRESEPRIIAQVIARDNPTQVKSQRQLQRAATISVRLTDVNDNPPRFNRDNYFVIVFETIRIDTPILQLFTTDLDSGDNARSIYRKIPNQGDDFDDLFGVQSGLGRVLVQKPLTGKVGTYKFFVQAQDNLGRGFITNATVTVEVRRSANAPPIWIVPPRDNMTIYVLEEQYNGMMIYDVSARDEDSGPNGVVEYSFIFEGEITQATPEFKINKVTGVIQAEIVYDREKVDRYVLLLRASDRGDTQLETTRFLTVSIKDVNDNVPTFPQDEVEFVVNEDAPVGTALGRVEAVDRDLNPIVKYRIIAGNEDDVFGIDEDLGELFLKKPLDTELRQIYYIDIQATNNEPSYSVIRNRRKRAIDPSIVTVRVIVGDINDQAPQFLEDRYYGCISTRSQYGKQILPVRALDRDAIGTGIVVYSINETEYRGNVVENDFFSINPKFGVISNKVLMRSHVDKTFDLTVNARDGLDPADSESSNVNVKIFVTQPGKEVKLLITQNTAEVRLYQSQIQSIIEQSANIDYLCIIDVEDHVIDSVGSTSTLWSDVYVSGVRIQDDGSMRILGARELTNIINFERTNRKNDFDLLYIKEVEAASSSSELELDDKAVIIILIIIAVLIFLVIIFCIVAFMCIKAAKTTKKRRLVHRTNTAPPAPIIIAEPEPEPVIYDNRAFIQEVETPVVPQQEVYHTDPVHVTYAIAQRSPSPMIEHTTTTTEYRQSDPIDDDQVIVVSLDDDREPMTLPVYEPQQGNEYTIETEVVQE